MVFYKTIRGMLLFSVAWKTDLRSTTRIPLNIVIGICCFGTGKMISENNWHTWLMIAHIDSHKLMINCQRDGIGTCCEFLNPLTLFFVSYYNLNLLAYQELKWSFVWYSIFHLSHV